MRNLVLVAMLITMISCSGDSNDPIDVVIAPKKSFIQDHLGKTIATEVKNENQTETLNKIWVSFDSKIMAQMAYWQTEPLEVSFKCSNLQVLSYSDSEEMIELYILYLGVLDGNFGDYEGIIRLYKDGKVEVDWMRNGTWTELDSWNYTTEEDVCQPWEQ